MNRDLCKRKNCLCRTCFEFDDCDIVRGCPCSEDVMTCELRNCIDYVCDPERLEKTTIDPKKIHFTEMPPSEEEIKAIQKDLQKNDETVEPINVVMHREICEELNKLYERKNHDYGDSFHETFLEEGFAMARIRLADKFSRFKTLSKSEEKKVKDESIRDTLMDLANYAIMTIMEIDRNKKEG